MEWKNVRIIRVEAVAYEVQVKTADGWATVNYYESDDAETARMQAMESARVWEDNLKLAPGDAPERNSK